MFRKAIYSFAVMLPACSAAGASDIRRVVTGLDANNKAVVMFDSRMLLQSGPYGLTSTNLWVTNSYPLGFSFKDDTSAIPVGVSPLDNGTKFRVVEFPPLDAATEAKMEPGFLMKAVGAVAPARGLPVTHPLMHRTRSVDYAVVLSGEIDMMLDDSVVHLKPGDTIVQQATNHAWVNRGTQACRILFVLMDSKQP
ncbi:MAG TPA: cupin domain-containing protein [Bradyrhizobium sp.]|nr:cupin domain-containing protein [Bradyrhizobium sp.]